MYDSLFLCLKHAIMQGIKLGHPLQMDIVKTIIMNPL